MSKIQYENYSAVTATDDTEVGDHDAIYIGTGGVINVKAHSTASVVGFSVPDGALLPIRVWSIQNTGTTASNIVLVKDA